MVTLSDREGVMVRRILVAAAVVALLGVVSVGPAGAARGGQDKVEVCHLTGVGTLAFPEGISISHVPYGHVVIVGAPAAVAHWRHNDLTGKVGITADGHCLDPTELPDLAARGLAVGTGTIEQDE